MALEAETPWEAIPKTDTRFHASSGTCEPYRVGTNPSSKVYGAGAPVEFDS